MFASEDHDCVYVLGRQGLTHVGAALHRALTRMGLTSELVPVEPAFDVPRLVQAIYWRAAGRRPPRWRRLAMQLVRRGPGILIMAGLPVLPGRLVAQLRDRRWLTACLTTDSPFNSALSSPWIREAVSAFDHVFSPRKADMEPLVDLGVKHVHYLPFACEHAIFKPASDLAEGKLLFIGGGSERRESWIRSLGRSITVYGNDWSDSFRSEMDHRGVIAPEQAARLSSRALANVILLNDKNRDGHVMRTFEAAASGGVLLLEDSPEHRTFFDGCEGALFFSSAAELAAAAARVAAWTPERRERARRAVLAWPATQTCGYEHRAMQVLEALLPDPRSTCGRSN